MKGLFRAMLRIRMIEEKIAALYPEQEMRCPVHLSIGQEATAVGVCAALRSSDLVMSSHRSHGHFLAKGGDLKSMLAELYGKRTGCAGGKGGSMHFVDRPAGFLGATPIVGSTIPIAVGAALAAARRGEDRVVVAFFGEAATEEGVFHEAVNFAALHKLRVVFACENNLYSVYSPLSVRQPGGRSVSDLARGHGLKTLSCEGNDVIAVSETSAEAVRSARSGAGPVFIEMSTYRWREHCGANYDNNIGYREEAEFLAWKEKCPVSAFQKRGFDEGWLTPPQLSAMERELSLEISEAVRFAKDSPFPGPEELMNRVYAPADAAPAAASGRKGAKGTRELRFFEALREATELAMEADPSVYVMGLGVPDPKGVFGTTLGLQRTFGADRVLDMPTSENGMTGVAIGSALLGLRPILVHQRGDFAILSMEQLVNQAAKWHSMFDGKTRVPLVVRMVVGRGWGQGAQHSQSLQSWFAHIPGLKVVMPSTPSDAKGLLLSSIWDGNPVIFIEHRWLHGVRGPVPEGLTLEPLGKARVLRPGRDVTLLGVSYMTLESLRAAEYLAAEGVDAEVVDVRTVRPLDEAAILISLRKTGRLIVADTGWLTAGFAAEAIAVAAEKGFASLQAPPRRLGLSDCPVPSTPALANLCYPHAWDIAVAALETLGRKPKAAPPKPTGPLDVPDPSFTGPF